MSAAHRLIARRVPVLLKAPVMESSAGELARTARELGAGGSRRPASHHGPEPADPADQRSSALRILH